jgi:DNA-binding response OmpR family regulator
VTLRVLLVEPDAHTRALVERVLSAEGYVTEGFADARDARILLDDGAFDLALANEHGASGSLLEGVQFLRARYPSLPVVVVGALLSPPVVLRLLRLGVRDVVPKPFSPNEIREVMARVGAAAAVRVEARDYAAAMDLARDALGALRLDDAARALARARALAPLDPAVMALDALHAELDGRDDDADRGYRAAMALRLAPDDDAPAPAEGIARLAAYDRAPKVSALPAALRDAPSTLVRDPVDAPPVETTPSLRVFGVALARGDGAAVLRARGDHGFALLTVAPDDPRAGALLRGLRGGAA